MRSATQLFNRLNYRLPPWAYWRPERWSSEGGDCREIVDNQLGWDITDFGRENYSRWGLLLFTVRNGHPQRREAKPYAEKAMVVEVRQETPYHFHWLKVEDIINRGGGTLVLELYQSDENNRLSDVPFDVFIDGFRRSCKAGERVELSPGESITLPPKLYHRFWAEKEVVFVGEVSSVNDDAADNCFLERLSRFPTIVEDEPPLHVLVSDYEHFLQSKR